MHRCSSVEQFLSGFTTLPRSLLEASLESGFQAVYDHQEFQVALKEQGQYACAGNFAWLQMAYTTSPGVPYNEAAVHKMKRFYFPDMKAPKRFPSVVVVAVEGDQRTNGMMNFKGGMHSLSPPELRHALVFKIAEVIAEKASDEIMQSWLRIVLSTMFLFEYCESPEHKSATADTLRESAVADYHGMAWTTLQKVYHVALFRQRKEQQMGSLTPEMVVEIFSKELLILVLRNGNAGQESNMRCVLSRVGQERKSAEDSEQVSANFVDCATTIYNRLLSKDTLRDMLIALDESFGHDGPLDGIKKLQALVSRSRTEDRARRVE